MRTFRSRADIPRLLAALCAAAVGLAGAAAGDFDQWKQTARYELEYRVDLEQWATVRPGSVRVWLPTPAENDHQRLLKEAIESSWGHRQTQDANGNRFVYLEPGGGESDAHEVVMHFVVERSPFAGVPKSKVQADTPLDPKRYLAAQTRVPLDGKVKELADRAADGIETDARKIRAFYDYVTETMSYRKDGEGWGRGDAVWACDAKYGNCTDFHSVIMGMCRSQGIPARFVIGFPIPADKPETEVKGYHCWAEAYDREVGWLPMDASEAWKAKRFDDYYGRLPSDRVGFTVGRDLVLEPRQAGEPLNFFIYPYVEVEGKPVGDVPWKLHARRVAVSDDAD